MAPMNLDANHLKSRDVSLYNLPLFLFGVLALTYEAVALGGIFVLIPILYNLSLIHRCR